MIMIMFLYSINSGSIKSGGVPFCLLVPLPALTDNTRVHAMSSCRVLFSFCLVQSNGQSSSCINCVWARSYRITYGETHNVAIILHHVTYMHVVALLQMQLPIHIYYGLENFHDSC